MKLLIWQVFLGLLLIILSLVLYVMHYMVFEDIFYLCKLSMMSFSFLPISVLFVTMIINQLLHMREKRIRLEKLNMVVGTFFTEAGTRLLTLFSKLDSNLDRIRPELIVADDWSEQKFLRIGKRLKNYDCVVDLQGFNLEDLRSLLSGKSNFLLRLLENPNILEHESFAELLRAVFHLTDELIARGDLKELPSTDLKHLGIDIKRAYISLIRQWLDYMRYLKNNYPYLFSLAIRTNPFDQHASPIVS